MEHDPGILKLLADYPTFIELPVQWGEQDLNGHVNHAAPVRWLESSRMAFIREHGVDEQLHDAGLSPMLSDLSCKYRRQIRFPDRVLVGARMSAQGHSWLAIQQAVVSLHQQAIAIEAEVRVVMFDRIAERPRRIPEAVIQALRGDAAPS